MRFDAKVDLWISIMFYAMVFMFVPIMFFVPQEELIYIFGVMLLMAFLTIPLIRLAYYELREDHLYMRLGYVFGKVKYVDIKSIEVKDGWGSSSGMALSRERVIIRKHGKSRLMGTIFISPDNREQFVLELKALCKNLDK